MGGSLWPPDSPRKASLRTSRNDFLGPDFKGEEATLVAPLLLSPADLGVTGTGSFLIGFSSSVVVLGSAFSWSSRSSETTVDVLGGDLGASWGSFGLLF